MSIACNDNIETCNCDQCRYVRWELTLKVTKIIMTVASADETFQLHDHGARLRRFLESESKGEAIAPHGPFTEENGWKRGEYGVMWGGGPVT